MKTKVFLTGLAFFALTMVGYAQNEQKGPGTGVCDGTGPKTGINLTSVLTQVYDAVLGIGIPVPTSTGDGICDCVGDCICDQDCIYDQDQIQDKDQLQDKDLLQDKDQIKAKDGTCINK
jgi:hypothetical protein